MRIEPPINWQEGMLLSPSHFQQHDRYLRSEIRSRFRYSSPYDWGIYSFDYDDDKLAQGIFSIYQISGLSRQGTSFELYEDGPISCLPAERKFDKMFEMNPGLEALAVYLVRTKANSFLNTVLPVREENQPLDTTDVEIRHPAFKVFFEEELEDLETEEVIKIAEVVGEKDRFHLRPEYVPAGLRLNFYSHVAKQSYLTDTLVGIIRMIEQRSQVLRSAISGAHEQDVAFKSSLSTYHYPILKAIHGVLPVLRHMSRGGNCHPEALYLKLVGTLGELTAYFPDGIEILERIPTYDHDRLGWCYNQLMQLYQHVLAAREFKAERVVSIPLSQELLEDKTVLTAQVLDVNGYSKNMLLEQAEWYIRVRAEEGGKAAFLEHIRVSAPEVIRQVIVFAAKNSVELLDREGYVPPGMPANTGAVYYQIKKNGRNWEAICSAQAFSIYATDESILDHVDRELVAVVQDSFES